MTRERRHRSSPSRTPFSGSFISAELHDSRRASSAAGTSAKATRPGMGALDALALRTLNVTSATGSDGITCARRARMEGVR